MQKKKGKKEIHATESKVVFVKWKFFINTTVIHSSTGTSTRVKREKNHALMGHSQIFSYQKHSVLLTSDWIKRLGGWRNQKHTFTFTIPLFEILISNKLFYSKGLFRHLAILFRQWLPHLSQGGNICWQWKNK